MGTTTVQFRNDCNQRFTRQLFHEQSINLAHEVRAIEAPYSLIGDYDGKVNFRKVYVSLGDPTGYKLASLYLEDYDHWRLLMKCRWFVEAKAIWDLELDAKLASEGLATIRTIADGDETIPASVSLSAAKYLANRDYRKGANGPAVGRPSREAVEGEIKRQAADAATVADDLARIKLVKG